MLSGTGYPSGENYPAGTGVELFFYPHAGTGNPTGKILQVRVRVRVGTTHQERTRCQTSRTAESRLPFPWSPEAPGKGRWGMRARHPATSDAYDLEPQMTCFLHHCSIGAGWSEPKHGVDQWEHSGAKHGAAHGDVTLEYGCTYIHVHWIKKNCKFFLLQTS
jgi:hypothetical protein